MTNRTKIRVKIIKLLAKIIILFVLLFLAINIGETTNVIFTNEMAMLQMEHSAESFVIPQTYHTIMIIVKYLCSFFAGVITFFIGKDIYKLIKEIMTNEEENNN